MESFMPKGVRKGAWTDEEDDLLRKCVLKFGEGRWHQVPSRAGLNRCRKSCRMRWLNYLKPSIKRGDFKEDEIDLLFKLHGLLGNRWSLIAGRLPGRTANDIKNYWNTHSKKNKQHLVQNKTPVGAAARIKEKEPIDSKTIDTVNVTVFKPRPRTFSKTRPWIWKNQDNDDTCSDIQNQSSCMELLMNPESDKWWETLLFDKEVNNHNWWETLLFDKDDDNATGKKD